MKNKLKSEVRSPKAKNQALKSEVRSPKAILHLITGDGKGKTTASLGLALRALGAEKKVKLIQFMKKPNFSEHKAIKKYNLPIEVETFGIGFYKILGDTHTEEEHKKSCQKAWAKAKETIESKDYDLVILDEINVAIGFGLLEIDEVISFLNSDSGSLKADSSQHQLVDVVLTGRRAHPKLKKIAQLVSDIKNTKNYFDQGQEARKGIEF